MENIEKRNYGIDLLRFILMFMVCVLHTLAQGGILYNAVNHNLYKILWFIEITSYCAVNGYAFISGYIAKDTKKNNEKIINMWFQIFFYSFVISIILKLFGFADFVGKRELIKYALPITFNVFWYMTSYFILFLVTPVLNNFLFKINKEKSKKTLIILFVVFSIINFYEDTFCTKLGYSPIWLIVLYCMGVLAKRVELFKKCKSSSLIIAMLFNISITLLLVVNYSNKTLLSYISPTIVLNGIIIVILFSRIKLKGTIIKKLSPYVLGIYLFQLNPIIWEYIIKDRFIFVLEQKFFISIISVFLLAGLIFISGLIVEYIRQKIFKLLKIEKLSKKVNVYLEKGLNKIISYI